MLHSVGVLMGVALYCTRQPRLCCQLSLLLGMRGQHQPVGSQLHLLQGMEWMLPSCPLAPSLHTLVPRRLRLRRHLCRHYRYLWYLWSAYVEAPAASL
jgi:hypothetical protein